VYKSGKAVLVIGGPGTGIAEGNEVRMLVKEGLPFAFQQYAVRINTDGDENRYEKLGDIMKQIVVTPDTD
jgi:hypothetical protein